MIPPESRHGPGVAVAALVVQGDSAGITGTLWARPAPSKMRAVNVERRDDGSRA